MGDKTESKLELRVETNRLLIPASSGDARLKDIPGYGWQPSVQAWEFDDHPGVAAIAMEVLGENLNIPEGQRTKVNRWKARLSKRTGPELKPQAIGNMCLLEHAPADTKWARLIPTYRPHGKASRFLKHPRVEALIEQVFGLAKSQVHVAATEKIKAPRDRKVRRRPVRAAGERAQEPAKEQPSAEPSVVDELAEILDHAETAEPARIAALIYELDARDRERAAVAAAIALRRLPGAADFKALLDFLLGQNQLGSDSIDGYAEFLNCAAAQKAGWLHQLTGEGVARLEEHSLQSVLQLGMKLAQDTTSRTPESEWKSLFRALGWDDRARLLLELFINFEWSHDVLGRLARLALAFVDEEPLPDVGPLIDLLDLCHDDVSWYSTSSKTRSCRTVTRKRYAHF